MVWHRRLYHVCAHAFQEEGRGRKGKKRRNVFIDDIADVDDDEEEEEEDVSGEATRDGS